MRRVFDGVAGGGAPGPRRAGEAVRHALSRLGPPRVSHWSALASACLDRERARWFTWAPVLFAAGAGVYFSLDEEPTIPLIGLVAALVAAWAWRYRQRGAPSHAALALLGAGFLAAAARTALVATPPLPFESRVVTVSGWIEQIEYRDRGARRVTVRPISVTDVTAERLSRRIRIVDRHKGPLVPGTAISIRARIYPPSGPVMPGGHDFARGAWFRGIGAVGYSLSPPAELKTNLSPPAFIRAVTAVEAARSALTGFIRVAAPGRSGDLLAALVTGQRSALPEASVTAMRDAGLAHLLAISGLHMTLVAGALFQILRGFLALWPTLALRRPIKKWAALGAVMGAAGYLVISGAAVSTQRAFIMMSVMFAAILVDRPAATMRNVAIAALIILAAAPENVLHAGFQMSFATVVALIAFYEWVSVFPKVRSGALNLGSRLLRQTTAISSTTLVAGVATAPIAAFHFHQLAAYSLAANIIAVPIVGLVVMPSALIGVLALPFGLADPFFALAAAAAEMVLTIADRVASWQGAIVHVAAVSSGHVLVMIAGGLWLCLWTGRWRLLGVAAIAGALLAPSAVVPPEVLIDRGGRNLAIRNRDGHLVIMSASRSTFAVEAWLRADGDGATPAQAATRSGLRCDPLGCSGRTGSGLRVAYILNPAVVFEECRTSDIVIAIAQVDRRQCRHPDILLSGRDLGDRAYAITRTRRGVIVEDARRRRGRRPWTFSGS